MEFRNLTPFDALCFSALDKQDIEHPVIVMKVGYRLLPIAGQPGQFSAEVLDDEPVPLCLADDYFGDKGHSSVREESDIAPFKPRCDVIINGHAFAPNGAPAKQWNAQIRISAPAVRPTIHVEPPRPWKPGAPLTEQQLYAWRDAKQEAEHRMATAPTRDTLLDKQLRFLGPRRFEKGFLGWHLSEPELATRVALQWENSFGGSCLVTHPENPSAPHLLNQVCYSNPLGCGWADKRYLKLAKKTGQSIDQLPAPQIEPVDRCIEELCLYEPSDGELTAQAMAEQAIKYPHTPAGFGVIGRSWAPRLALAGSYDDAWLAQRWPGLPGDFDFAYWNSAPRDQQIAFPPPNVRIELLNLTDPTQGKDGTASIELPGHRPFVLIRLRNGVLVPMPMLTDTLLIDTDAMTLSLTHRISLPSTDGIRVLEARFETDPEAPLLKRAPVPDAQEQESSSHG